MSEPKTLKMTLPDGWHDLNLEDRLKALLDTVGIPVSDKQVKRAIKDIDT